INKIKDKYYYTYCSNFYNGERPEGSPPAGEIAYMVSDSPMGPWTYKGTILKNPGHFFGVGGNNHHVIFEWHNQLYIAYHAQTLAKAMGIVKGYRSTHLNYVNMNEDGTIQEIVADYKGVEQQQTFNPYKKVEAETIGWQAGVNTKPIAIELLEENSLANRVLSNLHDGDWVGLSKVDFGERGAQRFIASILAGEVDSTLELRLDSPGGTLIGTLSIPAQEESQYEEYETTITGALGDLVLSHVFRGEIVKILNMMDYQIFTV